MNMKRFLWMPAMLTLMLSATSATAATIEQRVALASRTRIAVEPGIGHTIDFSQTTERVFRAWIGDGGQCLQVLGGSPLEEGTQIVNLRRIVCQDGLGFQPVAETVVTLTTQDENGQFNVYQFIVRYVDQGESLTRIVNTPPPSTSTAASTAASSRAAARTALSVEAVQAGLGTFELEEDSPVTAKVEAWAEAVEAGTGQRQAAQAAGLDWALLERLNAIGARTDLLAEGA